MRVKLDAEPGLSFGLYPGRPRAKGHVHLNGTGGISFVAGYLDHEEDRATTVAGLELCRRIMAQSPIADYVSCEFAPGAQAAGPEALLDHARGQGGMPGYHVVSSCRMGPDDASVVDLELRVRGVRRLRVVDASVMPDIVAANTHAPTIMIAERAADLLRRSRKGQSA